MGYYVMLDESTATIPAQNLAEAYRRLCDLNKRDDLKTGGAWSGGRQTARWFAWMDADYPSKCPDAAAIFEMLGFYTSILEDGSLSLDEYDSKTGSEDIFLNAVSDLFAPGSFMVWRGEDGAMWRTVLGGRTAINQSPTITWN